MHHHTYLTIYVYDEIIVCVPITFSKKKISVLICFPRNISSVCICVTYVELKHAVRAFEIYFFFRLKLQKKLISINVPCDVPIILNIIYI